MIKLGNLESNLARHCNLACTSCNHGSAVAPRWFMTPQSMANDLKLLGRVAHFSFHCLQGGEPLLNPDFLEFMDVQAQSGIADNYGMLTNGVLLDRMPEEFWLKAKRMNYEIRVSVYPALKTETLQFARAKAKELDLNFRPSNEFESFLKMFHDNPNGGAEVWKICPWKRCWTVHEGYFFNCPQAAFLPQQFPEKFPHVLNPYLAGVPDGVRLEDLTEEKLRWMMSHEEPLLACANCTGGTNVRIPWSQTRKREEWLAASTV